MKIIVKKVGSNPELREIDKLELSDMQALVGGLIQPIYLNDNIICWCNDEGKLLNMAPNIVLVDKSSFTICDIVHGDIFFTNSIEGKESLSDSQIYRLMKTLSNGHIPAVFF